MKRVAVVSLVICLAALLQVRLFKAGLTPACAADRAASVPDLGKIDRRIAKEPAYTAKEPLYGLYVFGPEARMRVWAVLDKSEPDAPTCDVLYFDRNADGDLTAADERIKGKVDGADTFFDIGTITDRASEQTHTGLSIHRRDGEYSMTMFQMKWCDKVVVRGGYAPVPGPYTQFATTPVEAPVLWPGADGAFSFQFWMVDPLQIGQAEHVKVFLGHQGHGKNSFCAVPDTFLPKEIPVIATLIYRDKDDKERRARSELTERC
jgi:hypothetical protein